MSEIIPSIELKGSCFTLSVIHIFDEKPENILNEIQKKINISPNFLQTAPVVINVAKLKNEIHWINLYKIVLNIGLRVIGVSGCKNSKLKKEIIKSGLPLLTECKYHKYKVKITEKLSTTREFSFCKKPLLIKTPVRSGQQIYARNGDLIITNSVSAGAEIIADGNIHIYGIMRGRALAGASGDWTSKIFCTNFSPELISIGGQYWLHDQIPDEFSGKSAQLSLQDGSLIIRPLIEHY